MFVTSMAGKPIPGSTFLVVFPQRVFNFDTVGNYLGECGDIIPRGQFNF